MENRPQIFNSPKNFKRGKYIFNRYRYFDITVILSTIGISIFLLIVFLNYFSDKNIILNLLISALILSPIVIVYLLYLPMPVYFNFLDYIKAFFFYTNKQKKWKWEGIHQFEERTDIDEN